MKVTYGAIVQRASGRFGGTVHTNWKGIDIVRRFAKPSNPNSVTQQDTRNAFRSLTQSYTLMSPFLRAAWVSYATGKPLIARNVWIGRNVPQLTGSTDLQDLVGTPGDASTIPLVAFSAVGGVGTITPTITAPSAPTGWSIEEVVLCACKDWSPSSSAPPGAGAQWFEQNDGSAPYNTPITGLAPNNYAAFAFIVWLAPDGSSRYSAATAVDQVTVT